MKIHFLLFTAFIKNVVNCGNILKTSTQPFATRNLNQVISVGITMTIRTSASIFYQLFKGRLAGTLRFPLMQNFFDKSLADTNSMKTGLKEVAQKL